MLTKCHFIGIGGIGMSGLAKLLLKKQVKVSGSDQAASANTEALEKSGAKIYIGHHASHIEPGTPIVFSSDINQENPEIVAARQYQCPLWHRSDLLCKLMEDYHALVIAGTHGKTTTTSLLTTVLMEAGFDPAYAVGGIVNQLQSNAGHGDGKYFVAEGDESDGTFLKYTPFGAIVTNIDFDHMNFYKTEETLVSSFKQFMDKVSSKDHLFWCGDDIRLANLHPKGISYGFSQTCNLRIENAHQEGWQNQFDIVFNQKRYEKITLALTGRHNVLNASAVFGLALSLNVPEAAIRKAMANFGGVKRRCEKKGEVFGIQVYDDYAHHPTEIEATLKAVRAAVNQKRLIAVFQPHRYTRMEHCIGTFGHCFAPASEIVVTDLYSAGEKPIPGVTTEKIVEEIKSHHEAPCHYIPRAQLSTFLRDFAKSQDVIITLGAGDITKLPGELLSELKSKHAKVSS